MESKNSDRESIWRTSFIQTTENKNYTLDFLKQEKQHKLCNFLFNLQSGEYRLLCLCPFCTKNVFIAHLQLNIHFYSNWSLYSMCQQSRGAYRESPSKVTNQVPCYNDPWKTPGHSLPLQSPLPPSNFAQSLTEWQWPKLWNHWVNHPNYIIPWY